MSFCMEFRQSFFPVDQRVYLKERSSLFIAVYHKGALILSNASSRYMTIQDSSCPPQDGIGKP